MIFIGDDATGPSEDRPADAAGRVASEIAVADLFAACSDELRRQALALGRLDAALGEALLAIRRQPPGADPGGPVSPALLSELQQADRLRQEAEGLARVLDLIVGGATLSGTVPSDRVRACSPLADLQDRLLARAGVKDPPGLAPRRVPAAGEEDHIGA